MFRFSFALAPDCAFARSNDTCYAFQDKFATNGLQAVQANIDRITCGYHMLA